MVLNGVVSSVSLIGDGCLNAHASIVYIASSTQKKTGSDSATQRTSCTTTRHTRHTVGMTLALARACLAGGCSSDAGCWLGCSLFYPLSRRIIMKMTRLARTRTKSHVVCVVLSPLRLLFLSLYLSRLLLDAGARMRNAHTKTCARAEMLRSRTRKKSHVMR